MGVYVPLLLPTQVYTRVAWMGDTVYLDLTNDKFEVVEITAAGWKIVTNPGVYFRRSTAMLPLPRPDPQGTLVDLLKLLPVRQESSEAKLIAGWLVHTLMPDGPYAHLCIHGEQGSAKSFLTKLRRRTIDPNKAPIKNQPTEQRDLAVMARHSHIVALDNLSTLPDWLSDALCELSTGPGFGARKLFTDDEETVFFALRPVVMNGIGEVAVRGDLIDRCVFITLPQRAEDTTKGEVGLWQKFAEAHPRILGAVLNAVSTALQNRTRISATKLPRMADFALWVEAAAPRNVSMKMRHPSAEITVAKPCSQPQFLEGLSSVD